MDVVALTLLFGLVGLFALGAWKARGWLAGRDRWAVVAAFARAVAAFAAAALLVDWVTAPPAVWLAAVALLAGGVAVAALRWPELPWAAPAHPLPRAVGAGTALLSSALVVGLVLA